MTLSQPRTASVTLINGSSLMPHLVDDDAVSEFLDRASAVLVDPDGVLAVRIKLPAPPMSDGRRTISVRDVQVPCRSILTVDVNSIEVQEPPPPQPPRVRSAG